MEISMGLGFGHTTEQTDSEIEFMSVAEIERVWGAYLKKIKFSGGLNFGGSLAPFTLADVAQVLESKVVSSLNDASQKEDCVLFLLKDGRVAFVWVAHCGDNCCSICVYSTLGIMGPSEVKE